MRDHTKLRAFEFADTLALAVYKATRSFPTEERFGLSLQMRRSAASVAYNIVEGCAYPTEAQFLRFLDIAYGSAREIEYQISLAFRLGYLAQDQFDSLHTASVESSKVLNGLIRSFRGD